MSLEACYLKKAAEKIHTACREGDSLFVKTVIEKFHYGSRQYFTLDRSLKTPFTVAKEHNQKVIIKLFMKLFWSDPYNHAYDLQVRSDYSPFHEACKIGDTRTVRQFLCVLNSAGKLFAKDRLGDTPLHTAVKASQIAVAVLIIQSANWCTSHILEKNSIGETALDIACRLGHVDFFKSTVEVIRANKHAAERLEGSALDIACILGHVDLFKRSAGVIKVNKHATEKVEAPEKKYAEFAKKYGLTIFDKRLLPEKNATSKLHLACERGDDKIVSSYCEYGDDLFIKDEEGRSPLHLACLYGHRSAIVSYIVRYGRDLDRLFVKDNYGQTPFLLGWEHIGVRELFFRIIGKEKARMDLLFIPDNQGKSLLHLACEYGFEEIVEEYINAYDPSDKTPLLCKKDSKDDIPLNSALRNGHEGVVNIYFRVFKERIENLFPFVKKDAIHFLPFLLLNGNKESASSFIKYMKLS